MCKFSTPPGDTDPQDLLTCQPAADKESQSLTGSPGPSGSEAGLGPHITKSCENDLLFVSTPHCQLLEVRDSLLSLNPVSLGP